MSMNLHCKQMDLFQTPTYITYLCVYGELHKKKWRQSNWRTIREKYLLWCQSLANQSQDHASHDAHAHKLRSFKKLDFYII